MQRTQPCTSYSVWSNSRLRPSARSFASRMSIGRLLELAYRCYAAPLFLIASRLYCTPALVAYYILSITCSALFGNCIPFLLQPSRLSSDYTAIRPFLLFRPCPLRICRAIARPHGRGSCAPSGWWHCLHQLPQLPPPCVACWLWTALPQAVS
mgnify:CR=1 FL=1